MDSHSVPTQRPTGALKVDGIVFDNNVYDREADVLYLHVGEPSEAVDAIGTAEGDGSFHGPDGSLVGLTILNARLRLEKDGKIELTLPDRTLVITDFGDVLA